MMKHDDVLFAWRSVRRQAATNSARRVTTERWSRTPRPSLRAVAHTRDGAEKTQHTVFAWL